MQITEGWTIGVSVVLCLAGIGMLAAGVLLWSESSLILIPLGLGLLFVTGYRFYLVANEKNKDAKRDKDRKAVKAARCPEYWTQSVDCKGKATCTNTFEDHRGKKMQIGPKPLSENLSDFNCADRVGTRLSYPFTELDAKCFYE
jgi:hypothetical protein